MNTASDQGDLTAALLDAVELFEELRVPYALIGGLAAMVYGRARYTEDVDFVAAEHHESALKANPDAMRRHHFDPACTYKLYHDRGVEIDLWKDAHADAIARRAARREIAGRKVRVAQLHDLIAMKLRAQRVRDDGDIAEIVKHRTIDESKLAERVTKQQLNRFRQIKRRALREAS